MRTFEDLNEHLIYQPKLWLHVGPAKTGTSSIQRTLRLNADHLAAAGLAYPALGHPELGPGTNNHGGLARALVRDETDWVATKLAGIAACDTVLSSEGFIKARAARLRWLAAELTPRFDLRVLYYVREPVSWAVSSAGQALKGGRLTYAEIVARETVKPRFRPQIEMLTQVFGAERLSVRAFDPKRFAGGDLIADFCTAIGRPGLLDGCPTARREGKITMEDIPYIEAQNGLRDPATLPQTPPDAATPFHLPPAYLNRIRAASEDDLAWLNDAYGIRFDSP